MTIKPELRHAAGELVAAEGARGWDLEVVTVAGLADFAARDGFATTAAMRDYFVPNEGDVFRGVLLAW